MVKKFFTTQDKKSDHYSPKIILASSSSYRAKILKNAGLDIMVQTAQIDERALEKEIGDITPKNLALFLSAAKAGEVSTRFPDYYVLGCDQTLELDNCVLHKPKNIKQAKERLQALSNKWHYLHSSISLYQGEKEIWHHIETAKMWVRDLDEKFLDWYLCHVGVGVLTSVGVYQIEREGIQIFDKVEGDHFTIIGLPLLPLLAQLRELKLII